MTRIATAPFLAGVALTLLSPPLVPEAAQDDPGAVPAGAARCLAPESGAVQWTHRLPASTWATPLGHGVHVYFFTRDGSTRVLRASADAPQVDATKPPVGRRAGHRVRRGG